MKTWADHSRASGCTFLWYPRIGGATNLRSVNMLKHVNIVTLLAKEVYGIQVFEEMNWQAIATPIKAYPQNTRNMEPKTLYGQVRVGHACAYIYISYHIYIYKYK